MSTKGSPKDHFTELALGFVFDLNDPISRNHRGCSLILRIMQMRIGKTEIEVITIPVRPPCLSGARPACLALRSIAGRLAGKPVLRHSSTGVGAFSER